MKSYSKYTKKEKKAKKIKEKHLTTNVCTNCPSTA